MGASPDWQQRNAALFYAAAQLERKVSAIDPNGGGEYIRAFNEAFQSYRARLSRAALLAELLRADVLLVADYHALPASQNYTARLLGQLSTAARRPLALALEAVFARDQRVLERWRAGKIDGHELRCQLRFDLEWGFGWAPFFRLLTAARRRNVCLYGLDIAPRGGFRRIAQRDEHAAERIASIAAAAPGRRIVVVFGESHMAPSHLPAAIQRSLPEARVVTLLQNVDPLYWQAQAEPGMPVEAVHVSDDVFCVFNATPLEKYESYRRRLECWRRGAGALPIEGSRKRRRPRDSALLEHARGQDDKLEL